MSDDGPDAGHAADTPSASDAVGPDRERTHDRLRALLEFASDHIFRLSPDGEIVEINRGGEEASGWSAEELAGKGFADLIYPEDVPEALDVFRRCMAGERVPSHRIRSLSKSGRVLAWDVSIAPIMDDGRVVELLGIARDATDRLEAEVSLREREASERRFRERLTVLHEVTLELTSASTVDDLCRRAVELGRSRLGFDRLGVWFLDDEPGMVRGSFGVDECGEVRDERECRVKYGSGSIMDQLISRQRASALHSDTSVFDDQGKPTGHGDIAIAAIWDGRNVVGCMPADNLLTGRPLMGEDRHLLELFAASLGHLCSLMRTRDLLRERETKLRVTVEQLPAILWTTDRDLRITSVAGGGLRALDLAPDGILGESMEELYPPTDTEQLPIAMHRRSLRGESVSYRDAWGGRSHASHLEPLRDSQGRIAGCIGIGLDTTDLDRAEQRYRTLVEAAPDVIYTLDPDGGLTSLNDAFESITGWSRTDFIGRSFVELIHPDDVERALALFAQVSGGKGLEQHELRILKNSGEFVVGEFTEVPLLQEGRVVGVLGIGRDATERRRAEEALRAAHDGLERRVAERTSELAASNASLAAEVDRRSEAEAELMDTTSYLDTIIQTSQDGILVVDGGGRFEFGNRALFETMGWPEDEMLGEHFIKVVPPDMHDFILERWEEVQRGEGAPYEVDILTKAGDRRSLAVSHTHMTIQGQRKYCVVLRDITQRKRSEGELVRHRERLEELVTERTARLQEANESLREETEKLGRVAQELREAERGFITLFHHAASGILVADAETASFHAANPAMCQMLGYSAEELLKLRVPDIHPEADVPRAMDTFRRIVEGEITSVEALPMKRKDGALRYVDIGAYWLNRDGRRYLVGSFRDVTERVQGQQQIAEYQERLRGMASELALSSERERRKLAQEVHDGLGQSLALTKLDLSEAVKAVSSATDRPCGFSECLPRVQRSLERIQTAMDQTRTFTEQLASPLLDELGLEAAVRKLGTELARQHGLKLHFEGGETSLPLSDDVAMVVYSAVRELLVNAIRHARASTLSIGLRRDDGTVSVWVEDDGIGFDAGALAERAIEKGGFGLLGIGERLRHVAGSFELTSERGLGTRAVLTVPLLSQGDDNTAEEG